jgi:quinol monooxygenase YgiN
MTAPTVTLAFVARLVAKPDLEQEVADFLTGAVDLANAEAGTVHWFAFRTDPSTFWIVDTFASEDARQAHIAGPIAQALMANADRLLAAAPEIMPADVLAAKLY